MSKKNAGQKVAGVISDAIPNEFSKMNSYSKFLPYPFNLIFQTVSAADRFGETYSNTGDLGTSAGYSANAFTGRSGDPNFYSPKNTGAEKQDFWMKTGNIGNFIPGPNGPAGPRQSPNNLPPSANIWFNDGSGRTLQGNPPGPQNGNFLSPAELQRQNQMNRVINNKQMWDAFRKGFESVGSSDGGSISDDQIKQILTLLMSHPQPSSFVPTQMSFYPQLQMAQPVGG